MHRVALAIAPAAADGIGGTDLAHDQLTLDHGEGLIGLHVRGSADDNEPVAAVDAFALAEADADLVVLALGDHVPLGDLIAAHDVDRLGSGLRHSLPHQGGVGTLEPGHRV